MNYKRIYNQIIENRKSNPLDVDDYGEVHHIIPKSLGGRDTTENLIRLSAREHFICHLLLSEMYDEGSNEWYKMNHAFLMMKCSSENQSRYMNSRLYELKRKDFSKVMSNSQSGKGNSQYGKPRKDETKRKIREALKYDGLTKRELRDLESKIRKETKEDNNKKYYKSLFEKFKNSNCSSIREFVRNGFYDKSHVSLTNNFKKYIKEYNPKPNRPYIIDS